MRRIMIVTNSLTGGGAERSMNLVGNELIMRGWPVALVPINSSEADLVTPTSAVFPLGRVWRGNIINTFSTFLKFNEVVRSWKPDVIVLNCDLPELFGSLLPRRVQYVVVEHSNLAWGRRLDAGRIVRKILSKRKTIWVAVNSHLKIWPNGQLPVAILQNPLTPSIASMREVPASRRLKRLIFLGRLSPEKRPELLLKIGAESGVEVEIIGDGLMKESLQNEVFKQNLKVIFSGYIHNPWSHILAGDLLIVPSTSEGDGLVILEGMKIGIPMLLSDIPEFRRFALPEKHYCRELGDFISKVDKYGENLDSLIVPEELRDSILSSRSLDSVGDAWEVFLNSI